MPRSITHRYLDPLDAVWLACAGKIGLRVRRESDVYASTDGAGLLLLSDAAGMDPDDCLAQMIFHELCHALVQGPESFAWVDWGLENETQRDDDLERACLRLQAALLDPLGLRQVFGPTTEFRSFYDALPADPFEERSAEDVPSIVRGRAAWARRRQAPWAPHLEEALERTAQIVRAAAAALPYPADLGGPPAPTLYEKVEPRAELHRTGLPMPRVKKGELSCESCAWCTKSAANGQMRCRQAEGRGTVGAAPACERYESALNCLTCGACCREAYDAVIVRPRDPALKVHKEKFIERNGSYDVPRQEGRCSFLEGGLRLPVIKPAIHSPRGEPEQVSPPSYIPGGAPFTCKIYEDRPQTCRDFTLGSAHCLHARRKVGLSR